MVAGDGLSSHAREAAEADEAAKAAEPRRPWSATFCMAYAAAACFLIPAGLYTGGVGPRWEKHDPEEVWHVRACILLVFSAFISEMLLFISQTVHVRALSEDGVAPPVRSHRLGDSALTLSAYVIKALTAWYLGWFDGGIIHQDTLAVPVPRPVYFGRFVQWSVAVPLLILLGNRPCLDGLSPRQFFSRSYPSLLSAFLYVWAAWVMEVTTVASVRWFMCAVSFSGVFIVILDQCALMRQHRDEPLGSYKVGLLVYSNVVNVSYGVVFMLSRFGFLASLTEQIYYAYADATLKVLQGSLLAMVRSRQDCMLLHRSWTSALAANRDLGNLIQMAKAPVFAVDMEGCIVSWNTNLQVLTGWKFEEVKGKPLRRLVTKECEDDLSKAMSKALAQSVAQANGAGQELHPLLVELAIPVRGGGESGAEPAAVRRLAMSLVPRAALDGGPPGLMAIGQDLSEILELKLVQDRRSALMAMLSHEIRSPLHGMTGLTAAMLDTEAGKTMHRQLSMVRNCATRLLDLVTNVMDLAQLEKRRLSGLPAPALSSPVDFAAIADEVVVMLSAAVDKANNPLVKPGVRLVNGLEGKKLPLVMGSPYQCTQLLYNLMTNACKFTDQGAVTLGADYDHAAKRLKITVSDTGRGISLEGQKRIFQPFEQECSGDSRSFQGIGLGLAVCKEIVDFHGGRLQLKSEIGQGSTFSVALTADGSLGWCAPRPPAMASEGEAPGAAEASEAAAPEGSRPQPSRAPKRHVVLSVDDCEVNQEIVKNTLQETYDVQVAMDGMQALEILRRGSANREALPSVVLLDIQMPGLTGFEVCEAIRKTVEATHTHMYIIMVSARTPHDVSAIESYRKGCTDFMSKPFSTQVLRRKVAVAVKIIDEARSGNAQAITTDYAAPAKILTQMSLQESAERLREAQQAAAAAESERDRSQEQRRELAEEVRRLRQQLARAERSERAERAERSGGDGLGPQDGGGRQAPADSEARLMLQVARVQLGALSKLAAGCQQMLQPPGGASPAHDGRGGSEASSCGSDRPPTAWSTEAWSTQDVGRIQGLSQHLDTMRYLARSTQAMLMGRERAPRSAGGLAAGQ